MAVGRVVTALAYEGSAAAARSGPRLVVAWFYRGGWSQARNRTRINLEHVPERVKGSLARAFARALEAAWNA
jgi:hypothetical protein